MNFENLYATLVVESSISFKIMLATLPLFAMLIAEDLILRYIYNKQSSLQRLTTKLSSSGVVDLVMRLTVWFPFGLSSMLLRYLTLPGIFLLVAIWVRDQISWQGLLGPMVVESYAISVIAWFLVYDFGYYVAHYLLHKIPFLWRLHKLHHSATEMNIVTGTRVSFAERAFNQLVSFAFVALVFGIPRPDMILILLLGHRLMDMLQHSDLPWSYGILGYVFVGPRFHRMHHSSNKDDFDANFGNIFSFWDYLFRTVSRRYRKLGSQISDEVMLGLDTKSETEKFNKWHFAIVHETIPYYLWRTFLYFRR